MAWKSFAQALLKFPKENEIVLVRLNGGQFGNPPVRLAKFTNGQWEGDGESGVNAIHPFVTHWHELPDFDE